MRENTQHVAANAKRRSQAVEQFPTRNAHRFPQEVPLNATSPNIRSLFPRRPPHCLADFLKCLNAVDKRFLGVVHQIGGVNLFLRNMLA